MFRSCGVTSDWLVPIRLFIGGLITLAVAAIVGNKPLEVLRHKEAWPSLLVFSLLGSALCQYSYYSSVQYANVAFATVISYCSPVVILLWTAIATRKKPRPYELCSVALVVLGAFTCVTHFDLTTLAVPVKGAVWGLISAVCFAFYTVSPRKLMQKYHVLTITGWGMTIGGVVMLLFFPSLAHPGRATQRQAHSAHDLRHHSGYGALLQPVPVRVQHRGQPGGQRTLLRRAYRLCDYLRAVSQYHLFLAGSAGLLPDFGHHPHHGSGQGPRACRLSFSCIL